MPNRRIIAALALAVIPAIANAELGDRWPTLAFASDESCELTITSSGRAMQIRGSGLIPGETLGFVIRNGDMKPIEFSLRAGGDGSVTRYYLPFRLNRDGGTVDVRIQAARCTLAASVPWTRNAATIP